MKKQISILLFILINNINLFAQPNIQWQSCLGGSDREDALSITQTNDSGYMVAGWATSHDGDVTNLHGSYDYWLTKLNNAGQMQWQKTYGGMGYNYAISMQQTTDSGYVVAGYTTSTDGDVTGNQGSYDYWILKVDVSGIKQWQKCYGGSHGEFAQSVRQTTDGGYIIAGYSNSNDSDVTLNHGNDDIWLIKLNNSGNLIWEKSLGGTGIDRATSVQQTTDSGYIVCGHSKSNDFDVSGHHGTNPNLKTDCWVVKLNSTGIIQWQKSLGGTDNDVASSIQQTLDGGFIFAGYSESIDGDVYGNHGGYDNWIVKLSITGDTLWEKSLGGTGDDYGASIQLTSDSGFIVSGYSNSNDGDVTGNHGGSDYWILKLNSTGNIEWQKSMGGTQNDFAYSVQQTTDGGFVVAGAAASLDGDVLNHQGTTPNNDYWVVKLSPVILGVDEGINIISNLSVIPNPVSQTATFSFSLLQSENIKVSVYDLTGRLVVNLFQGNLNPGIHQIKTSFNENSNVVDGIYVLNISGEKFSQSCKLVIVKK